MARHVRLDRPAPRLHLRPLLSPVIRRLESYRAHLPPHPFRSIPGAEADRSAIKPLQTSVRLRVRASTTPGNTSKCGSGRRLPTVKCQRATISSDGASKILLSELLATDSASSQASPTPAVGQPWLVHRKSAPWRGLELTLMVNTSLPWRSEPRSTRVATPICQLKRLR